MAAYSASPNLVYAASPTLFYTAYEEAVVTFFEAEVYSQVQTDDSESFSSAEVKSGNGQTVYGQPSEVSVNGY